MKRELRLIRPFSLTFILLLFNVPFGGVAAQQERAQPSTTPPVSKAETESQQQDDDDDDVVRISSNLVQFDAVVTDGKRRFITDLRPEDFEVTVNGKQQVVSELSFISGDDGSSVNHKASAKGRNDAAAAAAAAAGPPAPPVSLKPEQVRRTIALVVDDFGLSWESTHFVRQGLKKFVDEQMQPGDLVAIVRTSAGMGSLQQFTSDKRLLHRAIERVRWYPTGRGGVSAFAPLEGDPMAGARDLVPFQAESSPRGMSAGGDRSTDARDAGREFDEFREDIFAVGTLGALNFVVKGLRDMPGRKSVIVFSDGFEITRRDGSSDRVLEALRRLIDLANRASVVISTVDARGLVVFGLTAADNTSGMSQQQIENVISERSSKFFNTQSGLSYLAEGTGGTFVRNNNHLDDGVRRILEGEKSYYLIGFRPDDELFDPVRGRVRFNKLSVKVKRDGARVRTRNGFYGFTEERARPVLRTRSEQLIAALTSPVLSGAVPLRLTSLFASEADKSNVVSSLLHIDMSGFKFTEEPDGWRKTVLDVVALTFGENGQVIDQLNRTETIRARAESYDELLRHGLIYVVQVPVKKPGAYQLRVAVRDAGTEKVGSASQFIEVPDLKKDRLALSGIVLRGARPEDDPASGSTVNTKSSQSKAPDPLGSPAVRRFRQGGMVEYYHDIYNAKLDRATNRPQLKTQTRLYRDGQPVFTGNLIPYDPGQQPDMRRLRAGSRLRLGSEMKPGEYVLQVIVTDELAKEKHRTVSQWIDFEIIK